MTFEEKRKAINDLRNMAIPEYSPLYSSINFAIEAIANYDSVKTEQEPCTDAISRQAVLEAIEDDNRNAHYSCFASNYDAQCFKDIIKELPPVTPQYTDAEIQKMQDLEFAEIQKAYELGKAEGSSVLDRIRDEFISLYPKNYAGGLELGGVSCVFSLCLVLKIIDKYKASPTGAERSDKE